MILFSCAYFLGSCSSLFKCEGRCQFVSLHENDRKNYFFKDKCLPYLEFQSLDGIENHSMYLHHLSNEGSEALTLNHFLLSWLITQTRAQCSDRCAIVLCTPVLSTLSVISFFLSTGIYLSG